ncbi:MAG: hypothetical protein ACRDLQ_08640 [Solirubrobacterales bacterium]
MSWLRRHRGRSEPRAPGQGELLVGDPRFDDWEVVGDFDSVAAARAWRQHLEESGVEAVITSDRPLDRFGRGDIALRVPPGRWSEAEELLSGLDLED